MAVLNGKQDPNYLGALPTSCRSRGRQGHVTPRLYTDNLQWHCYYWAMNHSKDDYCAEKQTLTGLPLQECSLQSCNKVLQSQSPCQWLGKRPASIGCAVQCVIGSATFLQQNVICWVNLGGRCSSPSIAIGHLQKHVLKCMFSLAVCAVQHPDSCSQPSSQSITFSCKSGSDPAVHNGRHCKGDLFSSSISCAMRKPSFLTRESRQI